MGHQHGPPPGSSRALTISALLTGVYFVIELVAGLLIGSIAVLSDAFHTFSAVAGVGIALTAAWYAARPVTPERTFGFMRAEIFGAFVNGFLLLGMALIVIAMGYMRLDDPKDLSTTPMLLIAAGGLITEVIALALLFEAQKTDLNVKGAYWHIIQTFVGSLIIIVAAVVIRFTGFLEIDPILGILFGFALIWASYGILKESLDIFMQSAPADMDLNAIKSEIDAIPGVASAHHIHAWSVASGRAIFSAHVLVDGDADPGLLDRITQLLKHEHAVYFSTLQLETECVDEEPAELEFLR